MEDATLSIVVRLAMLLAGGGSIFAAWGMLFAETAGWRIIYCFSCISFSVMLYGLLAAGGRAGVL